MTLPCFPDLILALFDNGLQLLEPAVGALAKQRRTHVRAMIPLFATAVLTYETPAGQLNKKEAQLSNLRPSQGAERATLTRVGIMQLPKHNRSFQTQVDYGRYVAARLRQAKLEDMATTVEQASQEVKDKGRAWQDVSETVSTALAHRDATDDALDAQAREFRLRLASRGVGADKQAPYTSIFPKGVAYYTAAPLAENPARYKELLTRAVAALTPEDAALTTLQAELPSFIADFQQAVSGLDAARAAASMARTALEAAVDNWLLQMEKTYGALTHEFARKGADRFFPRSTSPTADDPAPEPSPPQA